MTEADEERLFCKRARNLGCIVFKLTSPTGAPDRMLITPDGKTLFFEFKFGRGRLREAQIAFRQKLFKNNFYRYYTVYSCDEGLKMLRQFFM